MIFGMNSITKFILVALIIFSPALSADESAAPLALPQLMALMAETPEAKAAFIEKRFLNILQKPMVLSGTLYYVRPNRIEKHILQPYEEHLVVEGDKLVFENPGKKQKRNLSLTDYPLAQAFVESIRSTLSGDLKTLERFYQVKLEGDKKNWLLILKPVDTQMLQYVEIIKIVGISNEIASVEILEISGDKSIMTIRQDRR